METSARPVLEVRPEKAKRLLAAGMKPGVARFWQMVMPFHERSRPWASHVMVTGRGVGVPAEELSMMNAPGKLDWGKSPMREPLA